MIAALLLALVFSLVLVWMYSNMYRAVMEDCKI